MCWRVVSAELGYRWDGLSRGCRAVARSEVVEERRKECILRSRVVYIEKRRTRRCEEAKTHERKEETTAQYEKCPKMHKRNRETKYAEFPETRTGEERNCQARPDSKHSVCVRFEEATTGARIGRAEG